ncbi:MAG: DUF1987 domain-containing protein [Flavobacteriales bacterium]|jgi:hypothetical protein|nr:DUF1987 domain-containing protein [Flavobacteriales bacterium]
MEKWTIEATDRSPYVVLDRQESILKIEGRSYPEEGMDFFDPILVRFKTLQDSDNPIKVVHVRLEYYNSATSKALAELFITMIRAKNRGHETKVIWEFEEDDDGIQEDIDMFIEAFDLTFDIRYTEFN